MKKIEDSLKQAGLAGKQRNYTKALEILTGIKDSGPEYPEIFLYLGRTLHALGQYQGALFYFEMYLGFCPSEKSGLFFMARSYFALNRYKECYLLLKKLELSDFNNRYLKGYIGLSLFHLKQTSKAYLYLQQAVVDLPDDRNLYQCYLKSLYVEALKCFHKGDFELSGQMFDFLAETNPGNVSIYLYSGMIAKHEADYAKAVNRFREALACEPDDPLIQTQLEMALAGDDDHDSNRDQSARKLSIEFFHKKDYLKAIHYGVISLKRNRQDPDLHLIIGEANRNLGHYEKAANHFKMQLKFTKDALEPRWGLILTYWQANEWVKINKELESLRRFADQEGYYYYYKCLIAPKLDFDIKIQQNLVIQAIKSNEPDSALYNRMGESYLADPDNDKLALKWFHYALKLSPKSREAYRGIIQYYNKFSDIPAKIEVYTQYFSMYEDFEYHQDFIESLFSQKEYQRVKDEIEKYFARYSGETRYLRMDALCHRQLNEYPRAAMLYKLLLQEDPKNSKFLNSLLFCYHKMGKQELAIRILKSAETYFEPDYTTLAAAGSFYLDQNDYRSALQYLTRACEKNRKDYRILNKIADVYMKLNLPEMVLKYQQKAQECHKNFD